MKIIEYISYLIIPLMLLSIIVYGFYKKEKVYELFIDGATDGMKVIKRIFPTLLAIIVAINIFRESGAMDIFIKLISPITRLIGIPSEIVPIGIMRPISGGASLGLLSDIFKTYGPDSMIGNIASTIMGATETTFYVIAIYTASVGIKNSKNTLYIALICDLVSICAAVWIWNII